MLIKDLIGLESKWATVTRKQGQYLEGLQSEQRKKFYRNKNIKLLVTIRLFVATNSLLLVFLITV